MKNNKKSIVVFSAVLLVFVFSLLVSLQCVSAAGGDAGGLVPCGSGTDPNDRCTLCDLIVGIKGIIDWGKNILVAAALAAITIGGVMYIVSAGNEQMMQSAKGVIKQAIWGVFIVLGAWLIVNTTMWLLATKDSSGEGGGLGIGVTSWSEFDCKTD